MLKKSSLFFKSVRVLVKSPTLPDTASFAVLNEPLKFATKFVTLVFIPAKSFFQAILRRPIIARKGKSVPTILSIPVLNNTEISLIDFPEENTITARLLNEEATLSAIPLNNSNVPITAEPIVISLMSSGLLSTNLSNPSASVTIFLEIHSIGFMRDVKALPTIEANS